MSIFSIVGKIYYTDEALPPASEYSEGDLMFDLPNEDVYVRQGGQWVLIDAPPAIKYYPTFADLRAATSVLSPMVLIGGRDVVGDGGAGFFVQDASITLPDNNGTVIYDADGNPWERVFDGPASGKWFYDGTVSPAQFVSLYDTIEQYHGHRIIEWSQLDINSASTITFSKDTTALNANFISATATFEADGAQVTFRDSVFSSPSGIFNFQTVNNGVISLETSKLENLAALYSGVFSRSCTFTGPVELRGGVLVDAISTNVARLHDGVVRGGRYTLENQALGHMSAVNVYGPVTMTGAVVIAERDDFLTNYTVTAMNITASGGNAVINGNYIKADNPNPANNPVVFGVMTQNAEINLANNYIEADTAHPTRYTAGVYALVHVDLRRGNVANNSINVVSKYSGTGSRIGVLIAGNPGKLANMMVAHNNILGNVGDGRTYSGISVSLPVSQVRMIGNLVSSCTNGISVHAGATNVTGAMNTFIACTNGVVGPYTLSTNDISW